MEERIKEEFAGSLVEAIGYDAASVVLSALEQPPTIAVRLNPAKRSEIPPVWLTDGREVEWCAQGRRLSQRPDFALDPHWHAGAYYVQEPASMVFSAIIQHITGMMDLSASGMLLDLCAAPGGKTTAVLSALPEHCRWVTVANEVIPSRAAVLRENIEKWGAPDVIVTSGSTKEICSVGEVFDIVLTDVPCSGEGMMRKEAVARSQWSPGLVTHCAALQRDIIADAMGALKPGGFLLYSTCTFNTAENEENIRWMCNEYGLEPLSLNLTGIGGIRGAAPGYADLPIMRFLPGYTDSEGLAVCVLRKPDATHRTHLKSSGVKASRIRLDWVKGFLDLYEFNGTIHALNKSAWPLLDALRKRCKVLAGGTPVATILNKGNKRIYEPTHAIALSLLLNSEALPLLPLDESQALSYLRRETALLPTTGPRGFRIPTYGSLPLGLVKNVGNRVNNLYPTGLRLRKQ